jgi:hypothetical protein
MGRFQKRRLSRVGSFLVDVEVEDGGTERTRVKVRVFQLRCPRRIEMGGLTEASTMWLSTRALESAVLGPLSLNLGGDPSGQYSISVSTDNGHWSPSVRPDLVGKGVTLADHCIEPIALETGKSTSFANSRWSSPGVEPAIHVGLFITPTRCERP